jgi:hypothetical protein
MNEYVQKGHSNKTAKIYSKQIAVHITATHTAQTKTTIYKNKSNQMTGSSYKNICFITGTWVNKNSNNSSKSPRTALNSLLFSEIKEQT